MLGTNLGVFCTVYMSLVRQRRQMRFTQLLGPVRTGKGASESSHTENVERTIK